MTQQLILVGNGPVGHRFVDQLVNTENADQYQITVFGEESWVAYDRVHLTNWFEKRSVEPLNMVPTGFYQQHGINCYVSDKLLKIDRQAGTVTSQSGRVLPYDKLVLATGSIPFVPSVPGHDRADCFVYRTIADLESIAETAGRSKIGVVVGGGLLGLEAARALHNLGLTTHVVEFASRLMAVQIDDVGGNILRKKIEALGVSVHTQKNTLNITDGESATHKMCFADKTELETDIMGL